MILACLTRRHGLCDIAGSPEKIRKYKKWEVLVRRILTDYKSNGKHELSVLFRRARASQFLFFFL